MVAVLVFSSLNLTTFAFAEAELENETVQVNNEWQRSVMGDIGTNDLVSDFSLTEQSEGHFTIGVSNNRGKISGSTEGIHYFFHEVPHNANYEISAIAHVDTWTANNQVSFGLMLRSNVLNNQRLNEFTGNYVAVGALDQGMKAFYKSGFVEGQHLGQQVKDGYEFSSARVPSVGEQYHLSIKKVGSVYTVTIGGETQVIEYQEALHFAGLYVARNASVTFSNINLSFQPTIELGDWEFARFGANTSEGRNPNPTVEANGEVTMIATGGKVASNDEGISFYYKEVPANANFEINTRATVKSFNSDSSISTPAQKSFGLMIRDHFEVGSTTQSSNYVAVGALDVSYLRGFYKYGVEGTQHSTGTQEKLTPFDVRVPASGEVYDLSIKKLGNLFVVTTNGQSEIISHSDLFHDNVFVGLYVARDAEITFSQFDIKTDARTATHLIVQSDLMKKDYLIGESLDLSGLVVSAVWFDEQGNERIDTLAQNEYVVTGFDSSISGSVTLTLHFNGASATMEVQIASLSVETLNILYYPAKMTYYLGDTFNQAGLVVTAQYNTGKIEQLSNDLFTINIPDAIVVDGQYVFETAGSIDVEVRSTESLDKIITFQVEVKDASLLELEIMQLPEKVRYFIGDELDLSGIVVFAKYSDDSEVRLLRNDFVTTPLDAATSGEKAIVISFKGLSTSFIVEVKEREIEKIEVTSYPKTTYVVEEDFDPTGLEVSLVYDNLEKELLAPEAYVIHLGDFNNSEAGTYTLQIVPNDPTIAAIQLRVTVREIVEYEWEFIRFGQSIGTNRNIWEVIQDGTLEEQIIRLEAVTGQNAGKITGDHDGITYYYTAIDALEDNFELSADIKVIHYAKTPHDGQESFGIMARDAIGKPNDSAVFSSNMAAVGGFAGRTIWPNGTQVFARTGVVSPDGEGSQDIQRIMLKEERPSSSNTYPVQDYRLTLTKTNSGFIGKLNNDYEAIIFQPDMLNVQDNKLYVGFYTAREATIEVHNIQFEVTAAATDAPKVEPPSERIKPKLEVLSLNKTPLTDYELKVRSNVGGILSVRQGLDEALSDIEVTAGNTVLLPTTLASNGNTNFSLTFIPDDTQYLTSYQPIVRNFTVETKSFLDGGDIYVSPTGSSQGVGTKENPLDIDTAIDFVLPGQKIIVLDGHYVRTAPLMIRRYNDGTQDALKYLMAEEGKRPVFDFDRISAGMLHEGNYWHVSGLDFTRSAGNTKGYHLAGSHNVIEFSRFYNNGDSGFQMSRIDYSLVTMDEWPSHNLIQYSVSFDNMDPAQNNADGFAIKLTVGEGNILRGVVAHNNVDDGYDLYTKVGSGPIGVVIIEDSIAFNNGMLTNGTGGGGDKNGFKLGGEGVHVPHIIRNSLAFHNGKYGITSNSNPGLIIEDSLVYNNQEGNLLISTYNHITPDFKIDGVISYQSERSGTQYRDRYPSSQEGVRNFFFDGSVSRNSDGLQLTKEQFIFSNVTLPINPNDLPNIVNQRDGNGNIVWGDFFSYILPGNEPGEQLPGQPGPTPSDPTQIVFYDNFEGVTRQSFDTPEYKSLPNDETKPMYIIKGGGSNLGVEAEQVLVTGGARFTIGALSSTDSTATTTPSGVFDLSKPYKITLDIAESSGERKFQVYVDNNTTGQANSIHGSMSRVYDAVAKDVPTGLLVIESDIGTENSFIQVRTEGNSGENFAQVKINSITIEYLEEKAEMPSLQWNEITFGQSTDLNFSSNVLPEKVGTNYALPSEPGTINGAIILESRGGKLAAGHDGLTFYYTKLDPTIHNFVLEADMFVEQFGPETTAGPNSQDSAGIMVRDVNGGARQVPMLLGFEEVPAASNIFGVGAVRVNSSNKDQIRIAPISRTGVVNPWGNFGSTFSAAPFSTNNSHNVNINTAIRVKLERTDTSFILSTTYTTHLGEEVTFESVVPGADLVQVIDPNNMYVGFYAARNAKIRIENASITLSEANTVASPVVEPPLANATMNIVSAPQSGSASYDLRILANYNGIISISKDGNVVASDEDVQANTVYAREMNLENEVTEFAVTYTPIGAPNGLPITKNIVVTKKIFNSGTGLFVSPVGTSAGLGTIDDPMDIVTAIQYVLPGETIYMRGGTYTPSSMIRISKEYSGIEGKRKSIVPYNGEHVVIDGQGTLSEILRLEADYWHLYGIELTRAASTSMRLKGDHNIIELMTFSYNGNTGLHVTGDGTNPNYWPKHNLILNSVSHHNEDPAQIDADGFAAKLGVGVGNVFRGNIAYNNIDDGWDLYNRINEGPNMPIVLDGNIAYGNRNGFKVGGEGLPVAHIVKNNLAFHNRMDGFTDNFNPGALIVENNTAFDNDRFNFIFRLNPYFTSEQQGIFKNNLSFRTNHDAIPDFVSGNVDETNFFFNGEKTVNSNGIVVEVSDFTSIEAPIGYEQGEDGNIVWGDFLRLAVNSLLNSLGADGSHVGALPATSETTPEEPGTPENPGSPEDRVPDESTLIVNNPQGKDGFITIDIAKETKRVLLPANADALNGNNRVRIQGDMLSIDIPAALITSLQKLIPVTEQQGGQIEISLTPIAEAEATKMIEKLNGANHATIAKSGELFELRLAIRGNNGAVHVLSRFEKPLLLSFKLSDNVNRNLVGIYFISTDGEIEYSGGTIVGDRIETEVHHFSKYGVLEYKKVFEDVKPGFWAEDVISKMAAKHIVKGVNETLFAPNKSVTRAEFAALIARALGLKGSEHSPFKDVSSDAWYASHVAAAYEAKIIFGKTKTSFDPNTTITREEMAVMLVRAYDYLNETQNTEDRLITFNDSRNVSVWALQSVGKAQYLGLVKGRGNNMFDPKASLTRAEATQVIANLLEITE